MKLNKQNYYSNEADWQYLSVSQFKDFDRCEAAALAKLKGEYVPSGDNTALLVGNYVHSYFESPKAHEKFKEENNKYLFSTRKPYGLLSAFKIAEEMIATLENDDFFNFVYQGEKEHVVTGNLFGAEFKGRIDCLNVEKGYFVDLKTTKAINSRFWSNKYRCYVSFVEEYGYVLQMAVYKKLLEAEFGKEFTPYIFAVSKETPPAKQAIEIIPQRFDFELKYLEERLPDVLMAKYGQKVPKRCEKCEYCRRTRQLSGFVEVADLID